MIPIDEGIPKEPCVTALWDDVKGMCSKLGWPPIISAFLLLFAVIFSSPFVKSNTNNENKEDKTQTKDRKE